MPSQPKLVLHVVPFSHPCLAVSGALDRLGLEYETVELVTGQHAEEVERVYGEGRRTVPGLLVDDEPAHGTVAIFARIDELRPDGGFYPDPVADAVREAEAGLAEELQQTARVLSFGALHFRPESMGTFAGLGQLDPPRRRLRDPVGARLLALPWHHRRAGPRHPAGAAEAAG